MDKKIKRVVRDYMKRLAALGVTAEKCLIFGSYAHGRATADSDLDMLIVSDGFKSMDLWERLCLLGRARRGINRPMEILGMTGEEFAEQKTGSFVADEIKARAVEI